MAEVQKKTNLDYINEIWNIADYVRDVISRADYNKVVLPFTLLRRLECALEPTRAAVCDAVKEHEKNWGRESDNYCQYSGKTFYNVIPFKLNNLGAGDAYVALDSYINGFSPNARNIMLKIHSPHSRDFSRELGGWTLLRLRKLFYALMTKKCYPQKYRLEIRSILTV